jgi:serine protease
MSHSRYGLPVRWGRLTTLAVAALLAALAVATTAQAASRPLSALAQGHDYRQGVVPLFVPGQARSHAAAAAGGNLSYGGGNFGVGVTTGTPHVYLILWGSQWGTQSTNAQGNATFSGDPKGVAPDLEAFFKGLGTGNETWSGVMTQYCEGIAAGSTSCPNSAPHVGYPTGGAFTAVWEDTSAAAPAQATQAQLGAEALKAAQHFGNTTTALNRNAQYFILSPNGTHPDGFPSTGFCAWHYFAGTTNKVAYTNMPYVPNAGLSCGADFVNPGAPGTIDGVTIVGGHEYAETITDQFPNGGWLDSAGAENGDKCAWIRSGQGAAQNITLSTGSFAVQSTWANDATGCEVSHAIFGQGNTVTVTGPGNQTTAVNTSVSLQIHATDSGGASLTYSATGLPAGLSINSSTGAITGTPTTAGSSAVQVTARDTTGASGSASFSWTITSASTCTPAQLLGNPGFETGSLAPWTATAGVLHASSVSEPSHSGNWDAIEGGHGTPTTDKLVQGVTLPSGCSSYKLSFWLHIDSTENPSTASDTMAVQLLVGTSVAATPATFSNQNAAAGYQQVTVDLSALAGTPVHLRFLGTETDSGGGTTRFVIDDVTLNVS